MLFRSGSFLVAHKDRLFRIDDDFQVAEALSGCDAVGCGADFALGALYAMPEKNVLKALEAAEFLANGVRRPFIIIET